MTASPCAHAGCTCEGTPPDGYCSIYCREAAGREQEGEGAASGSCECGHPPCGA